MNELIPNISIIQFFLLFGLCIGVYLLLDFLYKLIIIWNIRNNTGHRILQLEIFVRRITILILGIIIMAGIIMLNPFLHGFLFIVVIILGYESIKNVILGTVLHKEIELVKGRVYSIAEHSGILVQKGWTGLKLSSSGNKVFIPYSRVFKKGISAEQKSLTYKIILKGEVPEALQIGPLEEKIKSLLFLLPYLIEGQVPEVYARENNIYIEAGLLNESYADSLKSHLAIHGIETEIIENKT